MVRRLRSFSVSGSDKSELFLIRCFILLAAFFVCGAVLGIATGGYISGEAGETLSGLIINYLGYINGDPLKSAVFFKVLANSFLFPLLSLFFSTSIIGFLIIPPLLAARGFYLGFSAASIIKVLGADGKLLVFASYGLNALLTVPCLFLIAIYSMQISSNLFSSGILGAKSPGIYGKNIIKRLIICTFTIFAAAILDTYLTPYLVKLAASLVI